MTEEQREKKKEYDRRYRERNHEQVLVRKREWSREHPRQRSEEYYRKQREAALIRYQAKKASGFWKKPKLVLDKDDFSYGNDKWKALILEDKLWREKHGVK